MDSNSGAVKKLLSTARPVRSPCRGLDGSCELKLTVETVGYYRSLLRSFYCAPSTILISASVRP